LGKFGGDAAVIFTSQSGLTDAGRSALWDAWYLGHLEAMASVPGIGSAQRFAALDPGPPPSLAMYSIASPAVFESAIYLQTRGMGPWRTLIDPNHYRRNLFDGLDTAPAIAPTDILLVIDRAAPDPTGHGIAWLRAVGLDHSTPHRGIAVVADPVAARALATAIGGAVALYRPVTRRYTTP
jgi:hypothetical protein